MCGLSARAAMPEQLPTRARTRRRMCEADSDVSGLDTSSGGKAEALDGLLAGPRLVQQQAGV